LLSHEGYDVVEADSGKVGIRQLDADRLIVCVIADLHLACGATFDLVKAIKGSVRLRQIPILLTTTTQPDRALVMPAIEQGAASIVILPTDRKHILDKVESAIESGRPRILVVDDDEMIRDLLKNVLEIERFSVTTAASGEEALEVLNSTSVKAVVSDMLMPGMSGIDLLKKIQEMKADLPVLMITGYSGHHSPREIITAGAAGFFTKPFKNTELIKVLRQAIERGTTAPGGTASSESDSDKPQSAKRPANNSA